MSKPPCRIVYIGDVPVEDSIASGTLLFRLFHEYPAACLCIIETDLMSKTGEGRLLGVDHKILRIVSKPLLQTRLDRWALAWEWIGAKYYARQVCRLAKDFAPEAVVTTVPFSAWAIASCYAKMCSLPLHLLLWDDILSSPVVPRFLQNVYQRSFLSAYRAAASRFCISQEIERFYGNASGVPGTVIYPFGGPGLVSHTSMPKRNGGHLKRFTFVFAGSLFLGGYRKALEQFARAVKTAGCDLIVIGSFTQPAADKNSFADLGVRIEPYMPVNSLIDFVRENADALALVGSFEPTEQRYCSLLFPSRLVAYSATALPCFGYGPDTFTGVKWLAENIAQETVCNEDSHEKLVAAVKHFAAARDKHSSWGEALARAGARDFDFATARDAYYRAFARH